MKYVESSRQTTRRLLSGSVAFLALVLSSCTSTGDGTIPMQMSASTDGSMVAEALQSAADQSATAKTAAETDTEAEKVETRSETPKQATIAEAADPGKPQQAAISASEPSEEEPAQVAALASPTKPNSLFSLFGSKSGKTLPPPSPDTAETPSTDEPASVATVAPAEEPPQTAAEKPAEQEKPTEVTSLFGSAKNASAFVSPQRPAASQGSIARLFNDEVASSSGKSDNKERAVVKPASSSAKDYDYSLPGVRPNGGIEIKHRKSIYDDSDIDANEYDYYSGIQLASAPGLARLAPNGLKVQRETVDVACLKPQLVTMLKTMERHFRRPVMVTSGYRSPSYNRKVNGARRSLHMICAAADIQIDGVSKRELARYARSMPGRGGVGTYCHTKSVHVDVGPERDWNWRCRK
ncbi:DUF882 domain-containing protein [Falsochrobactrum sp. TDYN1]|uniref:DUF882 domain-containing protein n=1 Tax=Falsochrobactrum tianjinense TaxID=2706015 RepID=A0A949PM51_9HYPH|nr:YcbK family protein [Falsochrobactrum sp. TDYN1]MBV2143826.1 DUF882 domain-containing protein [Falsochrobactrum sp. TDYN1]